MKLVGILVLFVSQGVWAESEGVFSEAFESWEGFYEVRLKCQNLETDIACVEVATRVSVASVTVTNRGVFVLLSNKGDSWPLYGFNVLPSKDGKTAVGKTPGDLTAEITLDREGDGILKGWMRDPRIPSDVRVEATPVALEVRRSLARLYGRKFVGDPVTVSEVIGNFKGKISDDPGGSAFIKASAVDGQPTLSQASFRRSDNSVELFNEVSLDPIRGLVVMVQYQSKLPSRKWILAFRREDVEFTPWLLGTGLNLRKFTAYDVDLERN